MVVFYSYVSLPEGMFLDVSSFANPSDFHHALSPDVSRTLPAGMACSPRISAATRGMAPKAC